MIRCKYEKNKFRWNGKLAECIGCEEPLSDKNLDFKCRKTEKGLHFCNAKCSNGSHLQGDNLDEVTKMKLQCVCSKKVDGGRQCMWKYNKQIIDTKNLNC